MAEDTESEVQTDEALEASGGRRKLFLIAGVLLVVLLAGGAGTFFLVAGDEESTEESAEAEELTEEELAPKPMFQLDPVIVNVAEGQRDRYLKARLELELTSPELAEELRRREPHVKDLLISLLSAQQLGELRTLEGKNRLREEIQVRLNTLLRTGKVRQVFFTEFVIQ